MYLSKRADYTFIEAHLPLKVIMIKVQDLKKQFDKRGIAGVNGVSFSLEKGKIMAIMGPNGSGKTSLLKLLMGEATPESGAIQIDGPVSMFSNTQVHEDQNVQKFLISAVTLEIDEEKKIQLARDLADTFEFTFQLRQRLSELSSGQRQKILLAKELINRPVLLLMDEPFGYLDPFTRKDILKGLFAYIKDQSMTVLWVTHDLDEALYFSDQIGVLNFGKFEQIAGPNDLVRSPKNMFVAKFMGYRNFFPVKKENDNWMTPFGTFNFNYSENDEALLVVPDHAWVYDQGKKVLVQEIHPGKQVFEYVLKMDARKIFLSRGSQLKPLKAEVQITPQWKECFLITL